MKMKTEHTKARVNAALTCAVVSLEQLERRKVNLLVVVEGRRGAKGGIKRECHGGRRWQGVDR